MSDLKYEELICLVNKSLDNEINDEEFKSLTDLLSNNSAAQQIYLEMVDMHTSLDDISFSRIIKSKTSSRVKKKKKPIINFGLLSIAAVLALAGVFFYKVFPTEKEDVYSVIVEDSQNVHIKGQAVKVGQRVPSKLLEFEKGLLSLKFPAGSQLVIEGPAKLEILAGNHTHLYSGKVFAYVPPKAKGFSVTIDKQKIVDLGTSFAVDAADLHELHVFEGRVELLSDKWNKLGLGKGKAVKFSSSLEPQKIKLNKEKFAKLRNFAFPVKQFNFEKGLEGWTQTKMGEHFDRGDKKSSEQTKGLMRLVQSSKATLSNEDTFLKNSLKAHSSTGRIIPMPFYARDMSLRVVVLSSPPFTLLYGAGDIQAFIHGGCGGIEKLYGTLDELGTTSNKKGFIGIALRRLSDNSYVASVRRKARSRETFRKGWEKVTISVTELNSIIENSQPEERFVLDLVDSFSSKNAIWSWTALDSVIIPGKFKIKE